MKNNYREGYRTIYLGNHWMEVIAPTDNDKTYKDSLIFWAAAAKEWGRKMKVIKLPTYLDVHSYNRSMGGK